MLVETYVLVSILHFCIFKSANTFIYKGKFCYQFLYFSILGWKPLQQSKNSFPSYSIPPKLLIPLVYVNFH